VIKPTLVTINNNSLNYVFNGDGGLIGSGGLVKTGSGTLTIGTQNRHTGGSTINGGYVMIGQLGNNSLAFGTGGTLTVSNATLQMDGNPILNDMYIPAGSTATLTYERLFAWNSITGSSGSASGNFSGNLHGSGTLVIAMSGGGSNKPDANGNGSFIFNGVDNSDGTGYVNLIPDLDYPSPTCSWVLAMPTPAATWSGTRDSPRRRALPFARRSATCGSMICRLAPEWHRHPYGQSTASVGTLRRWILVVWAAIRPGPVTLLMPRWPRPTSPRPAWERWSSLEMC